MNAALRRLNALSPSDAAAALRRCCGSRRWAERMAATRPFEDPRAVARAADAAFDELERDDWLESFAAHPRIGGHSDEHDRVGGPAAWSRREQSGVDAAPSDVLERLERGNEAYFERFGYVFLIRAAGRSAEEMLAQLETRLELDATAELRNAADQQREITALRLEQLLNPMSPITTHVLDTTAGRPAAGVAVTLHQLDADGAWTEVAEAATDDDGRIADLLPPEHPAGEGTYRLRFETGAYFRDLGLAAFHPVVEIIFERSDAARHDHVPLLLSPFGYTTYRGS